MVMNTVNVLICLITLTSQHVYSKVITVNSDGKNSTECCVNGNCSCSSLYTALLHLDSNTVINITSQSVTLDRSTTMGSVDLSNITITGSNVTILCNNSGSVYCESCDHVVIEGITWDRCGDPNGTQSAALKFDAVGKISIKHCSFQHSMTRVIFLNPTGDLIVPSDVLFYEVNFINNTGISKLVNSKPGIVSIFAESFFGFIKITMNMVVFTSNQYIGSDGGAVYIHCLGDVTIYSSCHVLVQECEFVSNQSPGHGAALYVDTTSNYNTTVHIVKSIFDHNVAGSSVFYVRGEPSQYMEVQVDSSNFSNNTASSMYLSACELSFLGLVDFTNNKAESGGAMYLKQGTAIYILDGATVLFVNNTATLYGGAIYIELLLTCDTSTFGKVTMPSQYRAMFNGNSARIAGNSLYFNIPSSCPVNTNITDDQSLMYIPCQFNYSQIVNHTFKVIPCDFNYILLNGTGAPIVTSPHKLRLYFPFNKGYDILQSPTTSVYYIENNILGYEVLFTGAVFDYFGKPAEPTEFSIERQCFHSNCSAYSLIGDEHILIQTVDNFTVLAVNLKGRKAVTRNVNVTITLTSLFYSLKKITTTLTVQVVPCVTHPGFAYHNESQTCVCYHHNVKCNGSHSEIKRGYWFGSIEHHHDATTSLCPNHYCKFIGRIETTQGYFALPDKTDAQCNHHREGTACGKCSSGYTLSYDSTDCINVDKCGTGWTILVIVLTCLYWIAVVVGVFGLMYFNFQISSGYLYGIIYYYSMIGILLDNNPYVSDGAFQFISVLSSFAQLSPQFLGQLCFTKNMSGIDQLFIHYSHAVAVSLLILLIVLAARCSPRMTLFVSRCIIRGICLLILLSYTSIASTSLQLLRPLRFTDVNEVYTYSSPHIQYFHHQHAIYGSVAAISEVIIAIGIPLLLLLEPVLSRKINFIKIKPLLDQFQGCFKDKYRWFAAYYLICRQVIFLIVYTLNANYYNMLFYLQTACLVIVMIHMWIQPYQNDLLNALDGVTLLVMVLVVNINTFPFLHDVTTGISLFLVIFPLFLFSIIAVKEVVQNYVGKKSSHAYKRIIDIDSNSDDINSGQQHRALRNVEANNATKVLESQNYNTFQESFLEFTSDDN